MKNEMSLKSGLFFFFSVEYLLTAFTQLPILGEQPFQFVHYWQRDFHIMKKGISRLVLFLAQICGFFATRALHILIQVVLGIIPSTQ